jgi:hypothetical protein
MVMHAYNPSYSIQVWPMRKCETLSEKQTAMQNKDWEEHGQWLYRTQNVQYMFSTVQVNTNKIMARCLCVHAHMICSKGTECNKTTVFCFILFFFFF